MTAEIKAKMEAYRKQKAQFARKYDNALEEIRWHVTKALLEEFPTLEPAWFSIEDDPEFLLMVEIRIGDYGVQYKFGRRHIDNPELGIWDAVHVIGRELRIGPLRQMFEVSKP